jgi:hypothetical protein
MKHTIQIRDPRSRFGEPEVYVAECSCGWRGEERITGYAARSARRDGSRHLEIQGGAPTSPRPRRSRFLQCR